MYTTRCFISPAHWTSLRSASFCGSHLLLNRQCWVFASRSITLWPVCRSAEDKGNTLLPWLLLVWGVSHHALTIRQASFPFFRQVIVFITLYYFVTHLLPQHLHHFTRLLSLVDMGSFSLSHSCDLSKCIRKLLRHAYQSIAQLFSWSLVFRLFKTGSDDLTIGWWFYLNMFAFLSFSTTEFHSLTQAARTKTTTMSWTLNQSNVLDCFFSRDCMLYRSFAKECAVIRLWSSCFRSLERCLLSR